MILSAVPLRADDTAVELITRKNETVSGRLTQWTADRLTIRSGASQSISPGEIYSLRFPEHRLRPVEGDWVVLANGDRIAAAVLRTHDETAEAAWTAAPLRPHWSGALGNVSAFVFNFPAAPRIRREWLARIANAPAGNDQVQFITGERLSGEFAQLEGQQITVTASFGATQLDRQRVRWVRFDPELQSVPKIPQKYWCAWLTDGSRLTATDLRPGENLDVQLTLTVGGTFDIAWHQIARLQRFDDRLVPLSQRVPVSTKYTPYLSGERTLQTNRNVLGSPLTVRGVESAVGLGMTSAMSATYRIEPGDREFRAEVGIDDAAEGRGSARFRVLVDSRPMWESEELTGQMPLVSMPSVSLVGAKELTLQVDFGNAGDIGDIADWCDAMIFRIAAAQ